MNTILILLGLTGLVFLLVSYARHDRFAGPSSSAHHFDELGPVDERHHLVPHS